MTYASLRHASARTPLRFPPPRKEHRARDPLPLFALQLTNPSVEVTPSFECCKPTSSRESCRAGTGAPQSSSRSGFRDVFPSRKAALGIVPGHAPQAAATEPPLRNRWKQPQPRASKSSSQRPPADLGRTDRWVRSRVGSLLERTPVARSGWPSRSRHSASAELSRRSRSRAARAAECASSLTSSRSTTSANRLATSRNHKRSWQKPLRRVCDGLRIDPGCHVRKGGHS